MCGSDVILFNVVVCKDIMTRISGHDCEITLTMEY